MPHVVNAESLKWTRVGAPTLSTSTNTSHSQGSESSVSKVAIDEIRRGDVDEDSLVDRYSSVEIRLFCKLTTLLFLKSPS